MNAPLSRAVGSRVEQVAATIRARIAERSLAPGARLPSIRRLAAAMQVSPSTVVEAYERLVAAGAIRARRGSGFYVCGPSEPLTLSALAPRLERAVDPLWVSRQALETDEGVLKPGCGWLPADWMPQDALRRVLRALARSGADTALADYGTPLGLPGLRQLLARRMADRGIAVSPDQIILTESGTHALDLLCRFLLSPGDTVLVDDPCYFNFLALLRAHRAKVVGVPMTPAGPDVERFAAILAAERPRLYVTNAGLHNPTGAVASPAVAHRLLRLAEAHGLTIIEDDIFADFEEEPAPRLAALDGLERVIEVGSFAKTLSASARCGFIAMRPDWIEPLTDLKTATSFGGAHLASHIAFGILADGGYRRHMEGLRARLARARQRTLARLGDLGIEPWLEPRAGMFLWCRLPEGRDAAAVARHALGRGVVLAPGDAFSASRSAAAFLRFNVAQSADPRIYEVLAEAMTR